MFFQNFSQVTTLSANVGNSSAVVHFNLPKSKANMNTGGQLLLIGLILTALAILLPVSEGDGDIPSMDLDLTDCKKIMARIAKKTLKNFGICTRELKKNVTGNLEEFEKKLGCAIKCALFRMEILDEDGKVTKDRIQKFMDEMVPQDAHEFGHAITADCNESYGNKLDPEEEYCQSYNEYAQCMQGTLADVADKTGCHPGLTG